MPLSLKNILLAAANTVGGQAVIEGVMMRSKNRLAIAVRLPNGEIEVHERPWFSLTNHPLLKKPFVRGFPVLLETLVNGIKALNWSATQAVDEEEGELTGWHLAMSMIVAIAAALGLFVVLPHFFSVGMEWLGYGGDVDSLSFHAWDGLFKMLIFMGYIWAISFIPDIKRVFQYHGAEHKVIWSYEAGASLLPDSARINSRLHPRCGTAFMLFVLSVSIVLYSVLVPLLMMIYAPETFIFKHLYIVGVKLLLMIPISAMAYELIKFASKRESSIACKMLCWPGLALQVLTTREPDDQQIEVAIAALKCAVNMEE
ncbi:DUF1385 domain-containing protein [Desulfovibrio oxyclinae]|uniref:DUF1385 domain-containing protein n=1 Tax=Desulfovibrio oxyclinae TaxID=63560 RepID=UPI00037F9133|nr:DUF1385 domain-containing protein [Desulfovibrio oxyclinae]